MSAVIAESLARLAEVEKPTNPFPGLRPFEFHECHLFFGRDGQSEALSDKLGKTRFLAVVGTSGSGKSSLVRAGLLPALFGGMVASAGSYWRVAIMRPGNDPIANLTRALNSPDALGAQGAESSLQMALLEATLRRGNLGLVEAVRQANLASLENLLVLVDQFEEIFRVELGASTSSAPSPLQGEGWDGGRRLDVTPDPNPASAFSLNPRPNPPSARARELSEENDKAAFVKLLLAAKQQQDLPIYVVLTMRSDYLGDCAQFSDLPEAINEGQYLIPRMTREQRRAAITGPVAVGGAEITARLVNRLLNDVGDNPDQLPILQHALMRTWDEWKQKRPEHKEGHEGESIDSCCYEAIGGMAEALSIHADEAYDELSDDRHRRVAEKLFKCLSEKGPDNREVRRRATLGEICAVAEATEAEVITVIESFRKPGRSFLMPPAGEKLNAQQLIDISHESLIRNWKKLREWVKQEAQDARLYKRLADDAAGCRSLWRDPELLIALDWRKKLQPNEPWAGRYHPGFAAAIGFLQKSEQAQAEEVAEQERQREMEIQRAHREAEQARVLAEAQQRRAEVERQRAEEQAKATVKFKRLSTALVGLVFLALIAAGFAFKQREKAEKNERTARYAERYADAQRLIAVEKERTARQLNYVANINLAFAKRNLSAAYQVLDEFLPDPSAPASDDLRGFEWYYLWRQYHHELATFQTHQDVVGLVAFAPDGRTLASGHKLWEVATGKELATVKGHVGPASSLAFAPDGRTLASGGRHEVTGDGEIKLWEVATGKELATLKGHVGEVSSLAFAPDGQTLASGQGWLGNDEIKLWEVATGKELVTLKGHGGDVSSLAFAPDGQTLASGSQEGILGNGEIKLWEVATGKELATLKGHGGEVSLLAFAPDGRTLASGSGERTVKLWEVATRKELATLQGHTDRVQSVAFAPDGRTLATGSGDRTVKLWKVATGKELTTLQGHTGGVQSVAFALDGRRLASVGEDGTVKLWEVATRKELAPLQGHQSVAFTPDGRRLASWGGDRTVKLWEVATGKELATLKGHGRQVSSLAFAPDGRALASGDGDGTVKLWEVASGHEIATLKDGAGADLSVAVFAPDGRTLAIGSTFFSQPFDMYGVNTGIIKLWEMATGKELATLTGHSQVWSLAFAPDGRMLASGGPGLIGNGEIKLWEVATGKELATLQGHTKGVQSLAFAPDGRTLASGSADGTAKLWRVATRKALATLQGHAGEVSSVAFAPDGRTLATGNRDGTVKLWEVATRKELATLQGHTGGVQSVAFAPEGRMLASGSTDNTIRLWMGATNAEVARQRGDQ